MSYSYINGEFFAANQATISVQDRSFRFGDGCFETILIHNHQPYQLTEHLKRLSFGANALAIAINIEQISTAILQTIRKNKLENGTIRLTLSRGTGSQGYLPKDCSSTIVIEASPKVPPPNNAAKLALSSWRAIPPACLPTAAKLNQGLNSILARQAANKGGYDDALMLSINDAVCETSSANIFWLKDRKIYTPNLATGALAGTTRSAIMRLFEVAETNAKLAELASAEAVWITNSAIGIRPVSAIQTIKTAWQPHPKTDELQQAYQQDINDQCA